MEDKRAKIFRQINQILNKHEANQTDQELINRMIPKKVRLKKVYKRQKQLKNLQNDKSHQKSNKHSISIIKCNFLNKLIKMKIRGHYTVIYKYEDIDMKKLANANNNFSIFRILSNLKLVKLVNVKSNFSIIYDTDKRAKFTLTSVGEEYIDNLFLHHEKLKRHYLILFWISMFLLSAFILSLIVMIAIVSVSNLFGVGFTIALFGVIPLELISIISYHYANTFLYRKFKKYSANLISRKYFLNFLKKHHIKEPSINFKYNSTLPKLDEVMFASIKH